MKLKGLLIYLYFFLASATAGAQQYNYRHYTTKDGLPSATVYSVAQDDKGFIWFGTNQGVARFDGYGFKVFTVIDGLPDNDVLAVRKGINGKMWFIAFNKQLSYYDPKTQKIYVYDSYTLPTAPIDVREDSHGKVYIGTKDKGLCIIHEGKATILDTTQLSLLDNYATPFIDNNDQLWVSGRLRFFKHQDASSFHQLSDTSTYLWDFVKLHQTQNGRMICYMVRHILEVQDTTLGLIFRSADYNKDFAINNIESDSKDNLLVATKIGAFLIPHSKDLPIQKFLLQETISHFFEDNEGNYWFTSLSDGVYMISASNRLVQNFYNPQTPTNSKISSLFMLSDNIFFSTNSGKLSAFINDSLVTQSNSELYYSGLNNCVQLSDSLVQCYSNYGIIYFQSIFDPWLNKVSHKVNGYDSLLAAPTFSLPLSPVHVSLSAIKQVATDNRGHYWLAGKDGLIRLDVKKDEKRIDFTRLYNDRITSLCFTNKGQLWFTSLDSIGTVETNGDIKLIQLDSFGINGYVTSIVEDHYQHLWLATSGFGLYIFDGDSLYNLSSADGLSSGSASALLFHNKKIFLGTSMGVNIINVKPEAPYAGEIFPLSVNEALPSPDVSQLLIHNHWLYVATSKGVSRIPVTNFTSDSMTPKMYLTRLQVNEQDTLMANAYTFPYYLNSIKFEYLGLLLKADGNILYRYQMEGVDTGWVETPFTNTQYPALAPGKYMFRVDARSLQGPWSEKPATMQITILPPYWQTWWFRVLMGMLLLGVVVGVVYAVIRYYRNQSSIAQRMVALEGQALRAQMNPHFIFNALNAIHDFIANSDERSAHLYLGKFSLLIRKILEQSRKHEISLEEEVETLRLYMELELLRFPSQFEYSIACDKELLGAEIYLPPMLVQPYVENAIRHGLMNSGKKGVLQVDFQREDHALRVTIKDNGVGRRKAEEIASQRLKQHRSMAMDITKQRIHLQNNGDDGHGVMIIDLADENGIASGTSVSFLIPIEMEENGE